MALFALLHQSLQTGQALPATMPILERLAYHAMRSPHPKLRARGEKSSEENDMDLMEADHALEALDMPLTWDLGRVRVIGNFELTKHQNEQLSIYATATVALSHVTLGLNDLQGVIISLVGEADMGNGFEKVQERWARYESEA